MIALDELIQEIGAIKLSFKQGIYEATGQGVTAYGNFAQGAVWNVVRLKREEIAEQQLEKEKRSALRKANPNEYPDVPPAGQDGPDLYF